MVKLKFAILAAAAIASGAASAATQGTLGATSTGTFINTFTGATAQVQVLALKDAAMGPTSGKVPTAGQEGFGAQDKFCVVNSAGGATKLTFKNSSGVTGTDKFKATDSTGKTMDYQLTLWAGTGAKTAANLGADGFVLPAGQGVANSSACGDGNVNKSISLPGGVAMGLPETYTDTVTVVATPQ